MDLVESLPQAPQGRNSTEMKRTATDQFSWYSHKLELIKKTYSIWRPQDIFVDPSNNLRPFSIYPSTVSISTSHHQSHPPSWGAEKRDAEPKVLRRPCWMPDPWESPCEVDPLGPIFLWFSLNILVTRGKWIVMVKICSNINKSWCIIRWEKKWNRDGKTLHKHLCFHFVCHRVHHMIYIYIYIYSSNGMDMTCVADISSWIAWPLDWAPAPLEGAGLAGRLPLCLPHHRNWPPKNGGLSVLLHVFNPWSFW